MAVTMREYADVLSDACREDVAHCGNQDWYNYAMDAFTVWREVADCPSLLDLQSPELGLSGGLTPDYPATPGSDAASPRDSPSSEGLSAASTESPPALILSPNVVEQQVDFSTSPSSSDHSIDYIPHPTKNIFRCDLEDCPTFRDRRSLDRHLRESVAHLSILSPRFVCRCGKHMARWTNFKHHFQRNLANKHVFTSTHYRCICGKPYQDAQALISHQTSHHGRRGRPSLSRARKRPD